VPICVVVEEGRKRKRMRKRRKRRRRRRMWQWPFVCAVDADDWQKVCSPGK
jgi:hypothetical protein